MVKRLSALLLAVALVATACGDDGTDATTTTTPGETTTTAGDGGQPPTGESTLDVVKNRGTLICGVSGSSVAFSETQPDGSVTGFDADFCRAVAAAVFGDATKVEFRPLTAAERFEALRNGDVDVLFRNTTWTQSRDTDIAMDFGPTTYYDGQQVMGRRAQGLSEASTLADIPDGIIICTNAGTTTEKNITEALTNLGIEFNLVTVETFPDAMENFQAGTCDLVTTDGSGLVGNKATLDANDEWVIFPATPISKEPLGPTYRQNDSVWADVVNWTVFATIIADEKGVTSANVDDMLNVDDEATRLFGGEGELQTAMGLNADAFYQVIKQVGNYDEIYARNLNPVGLTREGSLNAGWQDFGLVYAPPAR